MKFIKYYILAGLLILLNIFDIYSTNFLIQQGCTEANKVVNYFIELYGIIDGLLIVKSFVLLGISVLIATMHIKLARKAIISCFIYYSFLMIRYNLYYIILVKGIV